MRIIPLEQVKKGMMLYQNIYRHDGLLVIPKGMKIGVDEIKTLEYFTVDYIYIEEKEQDEVLGFFAKMKKEKEEKILTLEIIREAYQYSTLWTAKFGENLFIELEKVLIKGKSLKYLNELRKTDGYSFVQAINAGIIIASILTKNIYYNKELVLLIYFATMHNVGRIKYPELFTHNKKFNENEYEVLKKVPLETYKIMRKIGYSMFDVKFMVETNEYWDGSGYPERIKGEDIEEFAQYILLANIYNALSTYRPYRGIYDPYDVLNIIKSEKNKKIGEKYIDIFMDRFTPYPIGTKVILNNNKYAIIKKIPGKRNFLPIVQIIDEITGEPKQVIDLGIEKNLRIRRILKSF